ncbi:hypothetical protein B0T16DRAFT_394642 [Cercophora newfieldiana]|uniref:Uncharacterized protein n=1 Tax=Cercophora newfieldiana TaxID=92897 RepID=A0AA39XRC1_9PEZI|nr:hypothetical protein B0T16DRAFT_394642 [Cercophora newfieldiana]
MSLLTFGAQHQFRSFKAVEATSGFMVEVHNAAMSNGVKYQPNIVLINAAGTSDASRNINISGIGHRMNVLLDDLYREIPGDGRVDNCVIEDNLDIRCWRNGGHGPGCTQTTAAATRGRLAGAAKLKGDGTRHCNMRSGPGTRPVQDYLWIDSVGKIRIFESKGGTRRG